MKKWIVLLVLLSFFNFAATCEKAPEIATENEVHQADPYLDDDAMDDLSASNAIDEDGAIEAEESAEESLEPESEEDNEQSDRLPFRSL